MYTCVCTNFLYSMCELRERVSVLRREKEEEVRLVEAKMEARLREKEKQYSQEEARVWGEGREREKREGEGWEGGGGGGELGKGGRRGVDRRGKKILANDNVVFFSFWGVK